MWQLPNSWHINFQNNLTWPNSNAAGISLDSRLKYNEITNRYAKKLHSLGSCSDNFPLIHISSIYLSISAGLWHKCHRVFSCASCTPARHAGSFGCLMTTLILITMANGTGHCVWRQSCKVPNQTHRGIAKWEMYAIKLIKICAEYRDMLPRPRLDLSGTPGLRPIGLSPGSWQTSLGMGSMSRYSAQILICTVSYDGLSPVRWQVIIWTNASLFIWPSEQIE